MPAPSAAMARAGIGIRPARPEDMDWLRDLYCAARAEEVSQLTWSDDLKRAFLGDQFRFQHIHYARTHPQADRLIVTRHGIAGASEDIGRLYLDRTSSPWRLVEITLDAAIRNRGIGGMLIQWLRIAASASGVAAVDLHVARDNIRARRFYARLGFRAVASLSATHLRMALDCPP